ncbi:MAG: HlyD family efflux transporter periplasmic adaptor subunit [Eubacteriales bacterium]|nr:HlyD family efflux transporter periplasmic adaptor subunit [Eubacteriales bacterium]
MQPKRWLSLSLGALMAMLPQITGALAETEQLSGTVVAGYETSVIAPFGGTVDSVNVRQGQWVSAGDTLTELCTTRVYAPVEGTVGGVTVKVGDGVDGAAMSIAPVHKYTVTASVSEVYGTTDPSQTFVSAGETVYLRCAKDRSHIAVGQIVSVSGTEYTVETTGGELYLEETVNVFRSDTYAFDTWIGAGDVSRTAAQEVQGSGSVVRLWVSEGDTVERGQLLFETVEGSLDNYMADGSRIATTTDGVIASLSLAVGQKATKGASVCTIYPRDGFQVAVVVPEDMISQIKQGDILRFFLDWNEEEPTWYEGTVAEISYVSTVTDGNTTTFTVYMDFDADESVRLGMTAVVELDV